MHIDRAANTNRGGELPDAGTVHLILAMAADELLTPEQARRELNFKSRQTIYNWLNDADDPLPATKKGGWRIRRGDLAAYVDRKGRKDRADAPERRESDQTLRSNLSKVLAVAQAALDYSHARRVFAAAQGSADLDSGGGDPISFAFIEKCGDELTRRSGMLLKAAEGMDEKTLHRLRFMLPSISSSQSLPSPESDEAGQAQGEAL